METTIMGYIGIICQTTVKPNRQRILKQERQVYASCWGNYVLAFAHHLPGLGSQAVPDVNPQVT